MSGFSYARPLLLANAETEDQALSGIKNSVSNYIEKQKKQGRLQSASVYFKKLDTPSWFCINPAEEYVCASLFKVVVMMGLLMEEDKQPGFLDHKYEYRSLAGYNENVTPLEKGKHYTMRKLIQSMVSRSDNIAYDLCWRNMPKENFAKILEDFHVKPYDIFHPVDYTLDARGYSKFFRALYNAGYLSNESSDFALKTLAESDFNAGFMRSMTDHFPVARKYGIRLTGTIKQLHEFAIFYYDKEPYMLGVMTKGPVEKELYPMLGDISAIVYQAVSSNAAASPPVAVLDIPSAGQ
jgi:beta-lactamase class A